MSEKAVCYDKNGVEFSVGDTMMGPDGEPFKVRGAITGAFGRKVFYTTDVERPPLSAPPHTSPTHDVDESGSFIIIWGD